MTLENVFFNGRSPVLPARGHLAFWIITAWGRVLLASNEWKPKMLLGILQRIGQPPLQRIICPDVNSADLEKPALGEWIKPMIETKSTRQLKQTFKNISGSTFPHFIFIFSQFNTRQLLYSNRLWSAVKSTFLDFGNSSPRYSETQTTHHFYFPLLPEGSGATEG